MQIQVVTIGKFKSEEYLKLFKRYLGLAGRFCSIEHIELPESKTADQAKAPTLALEKWLEKKSGRVFLTLLDERGKSMTSVVFSKQIEKMQNQGIQSWVFCVSGAHGFTDEFKKTRADLLLSLSDLTMAHELASVVLAEQIFRGFAILNRHPYHNE